MKRRLVVEGSILDRGLSGSTRLVVELQAALEGHPDFRVEILRPPRAAGWLQRFRLGRAMRWSFWLLVGFPVAAHPRRGDLLLSPIGVAPILQRRRTWVMLHDLNPVVVGADYDRGFVLLWRVFLFWTVTLARVRFLISSHEVEHLLLHRNRIPPSHVIRTHWPVGRTLRSVATEQYQRASQVDDRPLVLMVGATEPHKRFPIGLEAVQIARTASGMDIRLKLVGPVGRGEGDVADLSKSAVAAGWFERLANVDDTELAQLYREAVVLLVPSLTEGYCLPIVEAQANKCVVVHCRNRTLRETAGGRSLESDFHPAALAQNILRAIREVSRDDERLEEARIIALSYTWEEIIDDLGLIV
jgi:glycosyltransferase involved in cell wall biosynthesis